MFGGLGRAAFGSLFLLGCTGLNPLYADATGGETKGGPASTTGDTTESDPSRSTDPSQPTTPTTQTTLESTTDDSASATTHDVETSETTASSEESGGTTDVVPGDCSTYMQDCPEEQKCMPFASDGGAIWDSVGCFPVEPVSGAPGDSCFAKDPTSGFDDCDGTSMCWAVDIENDSVGVCAEFCGGSMDAPICESPAETCVQRNDGVIALCLSICNPLLQDCEDGFVCAPDDDGFACVPESGAGGTAGDACAFVNGCDPGYFCAAAAALNGCGSAACCTEFCDLTEDNFCEEPSVCLPFFDKGLAPPGYEDVGFCGAA